MSLLVGQMQIFQWTSGLAAQPVRSTLPSMGMALFGNRIQRKPTLDPVVPTKGMLLAAAFWWHKRRKMPKLQIVMSIAAKARFSSPRMADFWVFKINSSKNNFKFLGHPIPLPSNVPSKLYPAVSLCYHWDQVTVNFGQEPFEFEIPPAEGLNAFEHCDHCKQ